MGKDDLPQGITHTTPLQWEEKLGTVLSPSIPVWFTVEFAPMDLDSSILQRRCTRAGGRGGIHRASLQVFGAHLTVCYRPKQLAGGFSGTFENHSIFQQAFGSYHLLCFKWRPPSLSPSSSWSVPDLFAQSSPYIHISPTVHIKPFYFQHTYSGSIFLSEPTLI